MYYTNTCMFIFTPFFFLNNWNFMYLQYNTLLTVKQVPVIQQRKPQVFIVHSISTLCVLWKFGHKTCGLQIYLF